MTRENQRSNSFPPWLLYAKVERVEEVARLWVVLDKQNGLEMLLWRWAMEGSIFWKFFGLRGGDTRLEGFSGSTAESYDGASLGRATWSSSNSYMTLQHNGSDSQRESRSLKEKKTPKWRHIYQNY